MFNYVMSPTGRQLHESDKFLKLICGPYGSGKSCCCAVDVLANACAQTAAPDGVRYVRVGIIRSTYPELISTTRRSLMEVLPPSCGTITSAAVSPRGVYTIPLQDGTRVQLELELKALRSPDDCESLRSANWTFAWVNEATGICPEILAAVTGRVGRYPPQDLGGVRWGGVILDFNMPEQGSWLDNYLKNPEDNWLVVKQPPAAFKIEDEDGFRYEVNPEAENLRNLGSTEPGDPTEFVTDEEHNAYLRRRGMRYYENQINTLLKNGRTDVVDNMYCMLDVPIVDGKPVYPGFSRARHVATSKLDPIMFHDIIIGMDQSGIHPAAVVVQNQQGRWCVLDELYAENEGFENFLYGMLIPLLRSRYGTNPVVAAIDPSNKRDDWQAITPKVRLEEAGIPAVTEISNSPKIRIQTVEHMLNMDIGGLLISPACENLIRGFIHEYRYRRLRSSGSTGAAYTPSPEKNDSSHYHDALQYACLLIQQGAETQTDDYTEMARSLSAKRRVLRNVV